MRLNLGCGDDFRSGWLNVDRRRLYPDGPEFLCCDVKDLDGHISNENVDEIDAGEVLEALSWREVEPVLVALVRRLRPGGALSLRAPDHREIARTFLEGRISEEAAQVAFFGNQAYPEDRCCCLWTPIMVERRLNMVGLSVEQLESRDGYLYAVGRRPQ